MSKKSVQLEDRIPVTCKLPPELANLLKRFAEEKDGQNFFFRPIYIVQERNFDYFPYHEDQEQYFNHLELVFGYNFEFREEITSIEGHTVISTIEGNMVWHEDEKELISNYYSWNKMKPRKIRRFEEVRYSFMKDLKGQQVYISDWDDYFDAYGVEAIACWRKPKWIDVGYFFLQDEAEKFIARQPDPTDYRIFCNRANHGDYDMFFDLLKAMGNHLREKEEEVQSDRKIG